MASNRSVTISKKPEGVLAPLSLVQQRLWFLFQYDPQSPAYNISRAWRLRGSLNVPTLKTSLHQILARHEALRTTFLEIDGNPRQVVQPTPAIPLQERDFSSHSPLKLNEEIERYLIEEPLQPFHLFNGPLARFTLIRCAPNDHVLIITVHHLVFDGTSLKIFCQELSQCYQATLAGQKVPFASLPINYEDFVYWQQENLPEEKLVTQVAFWRQQLQGAPLVLEIPSDRLRPQNVLGSGNVQMFTISSQSISQLKALIQPQGVTLFMGLLAVFQILLARYSDQHDILVGTPIAGRTHSDVEKLIGFFVNTLVLRTQYTSQSTFRDILIQVRKTCLEGYRNSQLPFEKIVELLHPVRDPSRHPVVQTSFQVRQASDLQLHFPELEAHPFPVKKRTGHFDLHMVCEETASGMNGSLYYAQALFSDTAMVRFAKHYEILLKKLIANPDRPVDQTSFLTQTEIQQQIVAWNDTERIYPHKENLPALFEAQANTTPDAIAVSCGKEQLTYAQLDGRANQLAHHLQRLGVRPEVHVAVCLERGVDLMVSLLAILKSGGAYVPIDPAFPKERVAWMLEDAEVAVIVTEQHRNISLPLNNASIVCLDRERAVIGQNPKIPLNPQIVPENLAYILYTSGSTGKPKGVMVTHRGLLNYLNWAITTFGLKEGQGTVVHSSIGFDLTVTSLFCPLLVGECVQLLPESEGMQELVQALTNEWDYSFLKITPAHLEGITPLLNPEKLAGRIRTLIIGGEVLSENTLTYWRQYAPNTKLINEYGPTETVVGCCAYETSSPNTEINMVPIGRPIANTKIYILDKYLYPSPIGIPGELFIAGDGLARGYVQKPDLTAERFLPELFSIQGGTRQYRSGDRVRYRNDGNLEFIGRIDRQVKVRGYRIELGEIESALHKHPTVQEVVVLCREDLPGDKQLVAYMVLAKGASPDDSLLRTYLNKHLPKYMIPSQLVFLESLPLTSNGKVDKQALPVPEMKDRIQEMAYAAPNTVLEELLVQVWQEVLHLDLIGIHDNFFKLGGHSLLATRMISRLRHVLELDLPLRTLFEHPTIAQLALAIDFLLPHSFSDLP